jgi:hypothetical protein
VAKTDIRDGSLSSNFLVLIGVVALTSCPAEDVAARKAMAAHSRWWLHPPSMISYVPPPMFLDRWGKLWVDAVRHQGENVEKRDARPRKSLKPSGQDIWLRLGFSL